MLSSTSGGETSDESSSITKSDDDYDVVRSMLLPIAFIVLCLISLIVVRVSIWYFIKLIYSVHWWELMKHFWHKSPRFWQVSPLSSPTENDNNTEEGNNAGCLCSKSSGNMNNMNDYYHMLVELILPGKTCTKEDLREITFVAAGGRTPCDLKTLKDKSYDDGSGTVDTKQSSDDASVEDENEGVNEISKISCSRRHGFITSGSGIDCDTHPNVEEILSVEDETDESDIVDSIVSCNKFLESLEAGNGSQDNIRNSYRSGGNASTSIADTSSIGGTLTIDCESYTAENSHERHENVSSGEVVATSLCDVNINSDDDAMSSMENGKIRFGGREANSRRLFYSYSLDCENTSAGAPEIQNYIDACVKRSASSTSLGDGCYSCSICLQVIEIGDSIYSTRRCNHTFHTDCIRQWVTSNDCNNKINRMTSLSFDDIIVNNDCPNCRTPIFFSSY